MSDEKKYKYSLRVRIDPELYEHVKSEAARLNTDVSTYIRWCVRTSVYLDDLNSFIRMRHKKDE
jgi:predicted HicB family RNase H-like nuclease